MLEMSRAIRECSRSVVTRLGPHAARESWRVFECGDCGSCAKAEVQVCGRYDAKKMTISGVSSLSRPACDGHGSWIIQHARCHFD